MRRMTAIAILLFCSSAYAGPILVDTTGTVINVFSGTFEGGEIEGTGLLNVAGTAQILRYPNGDSVNLYSSLNMFGGYFESIECLNDGNPAAFINVFGGHVGSIATINCGYVNVFNGIVDFIGGYGATPGVNFFGYGFDWDFFEEDTYGPGRGGVLLTGYFYNGNPFSTVIGHDDGDPLTWYQTNLYDIGGPPVSVPEPGPLALMLGVLALLASRRKSAVV